MRKSIMLFLLSMMLFLTTGCGATEQNTNTTDEGKLHIYSTVYPLQDFAEKIGGDFVVVKSVYPAGADEHTFEPSQKEIINMANSDLFFYIGYGLEGFVNKVEPVLTDEGVLTYAIGESIDLEHAHDGEGIEEHPDEEAEDHGHGHGTEDEGHDHEDGVTEEHEHGAGENEGHEHGSGEDGHSHGDINPHLWLDPIYAKQMAQTILAILTEQMPEQGDYFENNYATFANEFNQLNNQFKEIAEKAENNSFIVSHAAYEAWENRYGLEQLSIAGISTSDEPSQKQLLGIIEEVNKKQLQYILVEQNVDNKLVEVIQKEAKIDALPIHNLSVLTKDDIKEGKDYFSIMESNLETLKTALNTK